MRSPIYAVALCVLVAPVSYAEWKTDQEKDPMTDATHVIVTTRAVAGPETMLTAACMGDKGRDFQLILFLPFVIDYEPSGHMWPEYEAHGRWRIDAAKAEGVDFQVLPSTPHVAHWPVIRKGRQQWLRKWAAGSRLVVQVPAYGRGLETIEFDITGFDPAPLAACYKP